MTFGSFIQPDEKARDAENLVDLLDVEILSGYRAVSQADDFRGRNRIFDRIVDRLRTLDFSYEDQCSAQYYYDIVRTLRDMNGQFDRVAEVGVFLGGSTSFLAGCIEQFDFDLDLIDVHAPYLRFAHERARRMFPEAASRIRLFHGDLPSYVRHVMRKQDGHSYVVHHDGSHQFNQVVKDMASLYYVREQLFAVIAQDTHLRGHPKYMNFVDLALNAVFGTDLKCATIGTSYRENHDATMPNQYQGNYFLPDAAEGVVIPMSVNRFYYPHPNQSIDDFLPPAR